MFSPPYINRREPEFIADMPCEERGRGTELASVVEVRDGAGSILWKEMLVLLDVVVDAAVDDARASMEEGGLFLPTVVALEAALRRACCIMLIIFD